MMGICVLRDLAVAAGRKKIADEFAAKEAEEGTISRMKWDAKVRQRQSKLSVKGESLERETVLQLMLDEAMDDEEERIRSVLNSSRFSSWLHASWHSCVCKVLCILSACDSNCGFG